MDSIYESKSPQSNTPASDVAGQLSADELSSFKRSGLLGPFDSPFSNDELDNMFDPLIKEINQMNDHPLYGRFSVRDWHLLMPQLSQLVKQPTVLAKLQQILGEDLILWRSKVFHKRAADGPIEWHQEWGAFNGEEIGNDKPSLLPTRNLSTGYWNLTIWVALQDVSMEMGPMQFITGSFTHRYPIDMIPMTDSAFWQDPFIHIETKEDLIERCQHSLLVLDIDSSEFLQDVDVNAMDFEQLKLHIYRQFEKLKAAITEEFDIKPDSLVTLVIKKGQYVIFPERTMHRSLANSSKLDRFGLNFRVTTADTLVYPSRLKGDNIDGSNIDISEHECVLLSGKPLNEANVYSK
jgi:non-heme Fe2+,alpha-ketoglutarate-dependent halogenase